MINAPMGSGKSFAICALAHTKIKSDPTLKVIIAVPQTIIASGFDNKRFVVDGDEVCWNVADNLCHESSNATISKLTEFLSTTCLPVPTTQTSRNIIVCTHATLVAAFKNDPNIFKDCLIVIDEAHHIQTEDDINLKELDNELGKLIKYAFNNNIQVGLTTATFFRGDRNGVLPSLIEKEFERYFQPIDEYLQSCQHLQNVTFDIVYYERDFSKPIYDKLNEECPCAGKFKPTLFYIPPVNSNVAPTKEEGGKNTSLKYIFKGVSGQQQPTLTYFDENGVQLAEGEEENSIYVQVQRFGQPVTFVDLVSGNDNIRDIKKKVINASHEDKKTALRIDGIIALNMFKEGASWKHAEQCFIVGQRGSLVDLVQINGRLYRDKPGKRSVATYYLVDGYVGTSEDKLEVSNNTFKAVFMVMLLEDMIIAPKIKCMRQKTSEDDISAVQEEVTVNVISELFSDNQEKYQKFFEDVSETFNDKGLTEFATLNDPNSKDKLQELYTKIVKEKLEEHDVECDLDTANSLAEHLWSKAMKKNKAIVSAVQGINVEDISFEVMNETPLGMYVAHTSKYYRNQDGNSEFYSTLKDLRAAINGNIEMMCQKLRNCLEWMKEFDKKPVKNSENLEEKKHASFLEDLVRARKLHIRNENKSCTKWREIYQFIATNEYRQENIFLSQQERMCNRIRNLCCWMDNNNRIPPKQIEPYGNLFTFLKIAKSGGRGPWHEEYQIIATNLGYPFLFDGPTSHEDTLIYICEWITNVNQSKEPKKRQNDKKEYDMAKFLGNIRCGRTPWQPEFQKIIERYNLPTLFNKNRKIAQYIEQFHDACKLFVQKKIHGEPYCLPNAYSDDEKEKVLGSFIGRVRNGKLKHLFAEFTAIATDYNCQEILEKTKDLSIDGRKDKQICNTKFIVQHFIQNNKEWPTLKTNKTLRSLHSHLKETFYKTNSSSGEIFPETIQYLTSINLLNEFFEKSNFLTTRSQEQIKLVSDNMEYKLEKGQFTSENENGTLARCRTLYKSIYKNGEIMELGKQYKKNILYKETIEFILEKCPEFFTETNKTGPKPK